MSAYSLVDSSASYLANVISKSGRNEVQFYPLDAGFPSDLTVKRHELQTNDSILCACWLNDTEKRPASQKRKAESSSETSNGSSSSTPLFVVSLASNEVWVFSPTSDSVIHKIHSGSPIKSVTESSHSGHFWGLDESAYMVEFSAVEGKVVGKMQASIKSSKTVPFNQILHTPLRFRKRGPEDTLLLAAHDLYIIDGTKAKKNVLGTVKVGQADILSIASVSDSKVLVETKNGVWCLDLSSQEQPPVCIGSALQVSALRSLDAYSIAYTDTGAEVYHITPASLEQAAQEERPIQRVACINTALRSVHFENIFSHQNGVFGVWYHGLQPRFVKISDSVKFSGNYEIPIETKEKNSVHEQNGHTGPNGHNGQNGSLEKQNVHAEVNFRPETSEIHNLQPAELFDSLSSELLGQNRPSAVLALCSSNDNENSIKETIRQFSKSENCSDLVENLFEIISSKVAADPTHKSSLSIWLKWVLLTHGGYISKQTTMASRLKALQKSLDAGMALIPKLLGLQGRLQLLKAQAEYRNRVTVGDDADADRDEREFEAINDTLNNTTIMEDSMMHAIEPEVVDAEEPAFSAFEDGEAA